MHFVMFKGKKENYEGNALYGCLVTKKGLQLINILKKGVTPDLNQNFHAFVDTVIASIILKKTRNPCHNAYELVTWGSSKKDAGKTLLFYILNHGVTIIADRMSVSKKARSSIMDMAQSKFASALEFKPLDNIYRKPGPVTPDTSDDCNTFTDTGGYTEVSPGSWNSKIQALNPADLSVDDYMDFAVAIPKPRNFPVSIVSQKEIDLFSIDQYKYLTEIINGHFNRKYRTAPSSQPPEFIIVDPPENLPSPPSRSHTVDPSFIDSLPPPPDAIFETRISKSTIKKMILESLIKHVKN